MNHRIIVSGRRAGVFGVLLALAAPAAAQAPSLTLEQTVLGRRGAVMFYAGFPAVEWTDAETVRFTVQGAGDGIERRREMGIALSKLPEINTTGLSLAGSARPRGAVAMWVEHENDLYFHRQGEAARRLTRDGRAKLEIEMAADARTIAFVRDGDLVVVDTATGVEIQLTEDGGEDVLNGRLDWVYQEEVYERGDFKGFWWSPDGQGIVFYRLDESAVKDFEIIDHVPDPGLETERGVVVETMHYPKAGDPNPAVRIGIARPRTGGFTWVDLDRYGPEVLVVRVGWTPDSGKVVLEVQNRVQTWLELIEADPATGAVEVLLREESDSWVNILDLPHWLADGSFLWLSDRTGYRHIYHHAADGALRAAVTSGEWSVGEILADDGDAGTVWFSGHRENSAETHAYRVGLDGAGLTRITEGAGTHEVTLSPDRTRFVEVWSSLRQPPVLRRCDADGAVLDVMQEARVPTERFGFRPHELHRVPNRAGFAMNAAVLKPVDFDPERSYPVFLDVYCGPATPRVRDDWNTGGDPFHQFLAQHGVIVLQVDNESASGAGQVHTATCYKSFGAGELRDLEDAVDWLCANSWADGARVAISGWSYGGTMAAYALTHSERFVLGLAGGGVYDWRLYDTIYTERYMDTPQANREGYDQSSCIRAAGQLRGHLVILHGTMDDNVHLQNAMQFAHALQKADRSFDLMVYPKARHAVRDPDQRLHMRRLEWQNIQEHLRPGR